MSEKQLKFWQHFFVFTEFQPGIQWRQKKKQNWILYYGSQQEYISIDMVESFPKNKVLGSLFAITNTYVHQRIQLSTQKKIQ